MGYQILKADINKNSEAIKNLLLNNFKNYSIQRYEWNYKNYFGEAPHCWLVLDDVSKEYVGIASLFLRKFLVKGEYVCGAVSADFAMDKNHRTLWPALRLQRAIKDFLNENKVEFIYGVPNRKAKGVLAKLGYEELGEYTCFVKKLKCFFKKYKLPDFVVKVLNFAFRLTIKELFYKRPHNIKVEVFKKFDERVNLLFEKAKNNLDITVQKNKHFLDWRYPESPFAGFEIFSVSDEKKNMLGYIVYFVKDEICNIADILCENAELHFNLLVSEFIKFAFSKKMQNISVNFLGGEDISEKLKEMGFFAQNSEGEIVILVRNASQCSEILRKKDSWVFFDGDTDYIPSGNLRREE